MGGKPLSDQDAEDDEATSLRDNNQETENMVNELLDGASDEEKDNKDIMQQIEEECKFEAQRDADLLQQRINEEIRLTIGPEDESLTQDRPRDEDVSKQPANGNFVYVKKGQAAGDGNKSASEESEDNNQRPLSKKQRKKERKAQEKKNQQLAQGAFEKVNALKKHVEQVLLDDGLESSDLTKLKAQNSKEEKKKKGTAASKQGEQIVENFQELTRKYQELAQKIN